MNMPNTGRPPMKLKLKKGALRKQLGVPEGRKISVEQLQAALHSSSPLTRKRAQFAKNAKKWKH